MGLPKMITIRMVKLKMRWLWSILDLEESQLLTTPDAIENQGQGYSFYTGRVIQLIDSIFYRWFTLFSSTAVAKVVHRWDKSGGDMRTKSFGWKYAEYDNDASAMSSTRGYFSTPEGDVRRILSA